MSSPTAPKTFESSVAHSEHHDRHGCFVVLCRLCGETYYAHYAPDMSWRSRHMMLDLTVAAHERICVVYQAMCVVQAAEQ
jgi:hypothetical protein